MSARHPAEPLACIAVLIGLVTFGAMLVTGALAKALATSALVYFAWRCGFARPFTPSEIFGFVAGVASAAFVLGVGR